MTNAPEWVRDPPSVRRPIQKAAASYIISLVGYPSHCLRTDLLPEKGMNVPYLHTFVLYFYFISSLQWVWSRLMTNINTFGTVNLKFEGNGNNLEDYNLPKLTQQEIKEIYNH